MLLLLKRTLYIYLQYNKTVPSFIPLALYTTNVIVNWFPVVATGTIDVLNLMLRLVSRFTWAIAKPHLIIFVWLTGLVSVIVYDPVAFKPNVWKPY